MLSKEKKRLINVEKLPLVSIITPLYNSEKYIEQCILGVQNQTYEFWELLIIDDHSDDDSLDIVKLFAQNDPRIMITSLQENKGAAYCRNMATESAQGEFISFLDADDFWHPEKLEKQVKFMLENSCDVSFSSYVQVDETGIPLRIITALPELSFEKQLRNNYIGNLTGIYNANSLGKIFSPNLRKRQDWAVWLEAIKRYGNPALGLQENLGFYRVNKNSLSSNKLNLIKHNFNFYRQHLDYSIPKSSYAMAVFFWEYFVVRRKQIKEVI